jgi:hypothetical protein
MGANSAVVLAVVLSSFVQAREGREYKAWASCKPGTWIKTRMEVERGGDVAVAEMTTSLVEVTKEKVVLEQSGKMTSRGKTVEIPAQKVEPGPKDVEGGKLLKQGDEELEVDGKKLKCHFEETEVEDKGVKSLYKVWRNSTVPGGMVRTEIRPAGAPAATTRIMTLQWEKK